MGAEISAAIFRGLLQDATRLAARVAAIAPQRQIRGTRLCPVN